MLKIDKLLSGLESIAPLSLSKAMIEKGEYDNSGIIIKQHDEISKVLFTLDLTVEAVLKAKRQKADTIVTHHPAIYYPISSLKYDDKITCSVLKAAENKMNVISFHLNLDVADNGIDVNLCKGLKGKNIKTVYPIINSNAYGRDFEIEPLTLGEIVKNAKKEFDTDKIICYGNRNSIISKVASFCGGGASQAEKYFGDAELIVTSDMPHHIVKGFIESNKCIMVIPHYAAEEYGFKVFFRDVVEKFGNSLEYIYNDDRRFR